MKLMGTLRLSHLAKSGPDDVARAIAPLRAELLAADWASPEDVVMQYPTALVDGCSIQIFLNDAHRVELAINYELGMIFINYAGCENTSTSVGESKRGKAA